MRHDVLWEKLAEWALQIDIFQTRFMSSILASANV